jgi:hypothetical protein
MAKRQSKPFPAQLPEVPGVEFRCYPKNPRYAVGSDGSVFSCSKFRTWIRKVETRNTAGYQRVKIAIDKKRRHMLVHQLVLETFVGERPSGMQCRHIDGNQLNNHVKNLRWGTASENKRDCVKHGTHVFQRFTDDEIKAVRESGLPPSKAAKLIGCSRSYASRLVRGLGRNGTTRTGK